MSTTPNAAVAIRVALMLLLLVSTADGTRGDLGAGRGFVIVAGDCGASCTNKPIGKAVDCAAACMAADLS